MIQLKKYTELFVTISMLAVYVALISSIVVDPSNRLLWGSLALSFVALMLLHLSYMPAPQNPYLGGLLPEERKAILDGINEGIK